MTTQEFNEAAELERSVKLSDKEANLLIRSIAGNSFGDVILPIQLNLERRARREGVNIQFVANNLVRFTRPGQWLRYLIQATSYEASA